MWSGGFALISALLSLYISFALALYNFALDLYSFELALYMF